MFMPLYCNTSTTFNFFILLFMKFYGLYMDEHSYMQAVSNFEKHIFYLGEWKMFQSRENVFAWKKHYSKSSSRNYESIIISHFSFLAAPNLHVSPKTNICWVKFCTEKLINASRKLRKLRNKYSVFIPNAAIFILERNLISPVDFDHVLGNHLWAMSAHHTINKTTL